jgi:hypothetical protein
MSPKPYQVNLLLVWALLPTAFVSADILAMSNALPPGCLCTMALCCDNATSATYDCSLLEAHLPFTSQFNGTEQADGTLPASGTVQDFCKPYLDGTLDGSTTICEAIAADPMFENRFGASSTQSSISGESCGDLVVESCPRRVESNATISTSTLYSQDRGTCQKSSSEHVSNDFSNITIGTASGCSKDKYGVLDVFASSLPTTSASSSCPDSTTFAFSVATASGAHGQRWMCYDYTAEINGAETNIRNLIVNLGGLPCYGLTPPPTSPPSISPAPTPTSSAHGQVVLLHIFVATLLGFFGAGSVV